MPDKHLIVSLHLFNQEGITQVTPYQEGHASKKAQIQRMFDRIARHYDFLNHALSLGIDRVWRRKAVAELSGYTNGRFLDVATGTGDVALLLLRKYPSATVIGVDIAEKMLEIARKKSGRKGLDQRITFENGDSENLRYPDNSFDAVTVAFGVRNFEDLQKGLSEMYRVVRPGGKAVILEFSKPRAFPFKHLFRLYFKHLLPFVGSLRSKDKRAYHYLYESVQVFPDYERFNAEMINAGWKDPHYHVLSMGICAIYTATK